jgi:WD40 repeat protein
MSAVATESPAGPADYKYWAFISYSHQDEKWAKRFHEALETYALPKDIVGQDVPAWGKVPKRLMPVFRDRDELPGAADLGETLVSSLNQSRTLLVVCSPAAAKSRWVNEEVRTFKSQGREQHVFAIIVDGEPNASDNAETAAAECFPPALRHRVNRRGEITSERVEPIAGDARKEKDGFDHALLKTVAGILRIDFASLVKRDEERRTKRTRIVIAGLAAVLGIVASLGVWGWIEKTRAESALLDAVASKLPLESRAILERQKIATTDVALLVAAAAYRLRADKDAYGSLQYAIGATSGLSKVVSLPGPIVAMSPDHRTVVTLEGSNLHLYDTSTGHLRGVPMPAGEGSEVLGAVFQSFPVAFSADGNIIASGGGNALRLWDAASGKPIGAPLQGHRGRIDAVAFSADGKLVASAALDGTVQLWDVVSGKASGEPLKPQAANLFALAFSPDSRILALGSDDTLRLWDVAGGKPIGASVAGHTQAIATIDFSRDGRTVLSGSLDGTSRFWDVATGRALGTLQDNARDVRIVAFSPNGRMIASGAADGTVRLWDASSGRPVGAPLRGHSKNVTALAFSADETTVTSISWDGTLRVRDLAGGQRPAMHATGQSANVPKLAFSPDGNSVVIVRSDGVARKWEPPRGAPSKSTILSENMKIVAVSADATTVVSSVRGELLLWDTASNQRRGVPMPVGQSASWLRMDRVPVAFNPRWKDSCVGHVERQHASTMGCCKRRTARAVAAGSFGKSNGRGVQCGWEDDCVCERGQDHPAVGCSQRPAARHTAGKRGYGLFGRFQSRRQNDRFGRRE